ncbi:aldo/keto reductase [Nonomuraea sp. NPDC049421]|uniref:aldo/keto reductase n=1 Tax=Nonomuraea sp. NPDC049421 TaxID=3155275 RepID=UPI00341FE911
MSAATMEYVPLGRTDLLVSRIALGSMGFADPAQGVNPWALDEEAAAPIFRRAVELGITLWDTANVYGGGTSEEIVGRAVKEYTRREDVVIATKVGLPMHNGPGGSGLSRKAILDQVDASLVRLGTDYIDLYQVHRFDPSTPVDETMEALHEVVTAGKVRYIGASSMWAWQFAKMQHAATHHGQTRFVSMQNQYSLVQREDEREMFPLLADQGVSSLPWCPLAKGRLARPYGQATDRSTRDPIGQRFFGDVDRPIVDAVHRIATVREIPMACVALAWVLGNHAVAAPVIGATRASHLDDAVAALAVQLDETERDAVESPYTPRRPTGF